MIFIKPARIVERVFIHCSASDDPELAGPALPSTIRRWHRKRGFRDIGYHYLFDKAGLSYFGRDISKMPAAQKGHNARTIAIMVHGLENFPEPMLDACKALCEKINAAYCGRISFHGHWQVNQNKTCPVFNYGSLLNLDRWGRMP